MYNQPFPCLEVKTNARRCFRTVEVYIYVNLTLIQALMERYPWIVSSCKGVSMVVATSEITFFYVADPLARHHPVSSKLITASSY